MKCTFMYIVLMISAFAFSQQFTEITTGITADGIENMIWGDLDNDGDLDVVTVGGNYKIYRNDGAGVFTDTGFETMGHFRNADLGDYDNDGDLDILFSGDWTSVYRNDSGTFTEVFPGLPGSDENNAQWGDYDNDGDLDVLLTDTPYETARIYRNEGNGVFSDINAEFMVMFNISASWVDYDCDGFLDVLLTGDQVIGPMKGYRTILYKNEGNEVFTYTISTLPDDAYIRLADWGDYDNDGDPDLLFTGYEFVTMLCRNDGNGVFTDIPAGLVGVYKGGGQWGDFDNDGDLDIIMSGAYTNYPSWQCATRVYRNDGGGVFTDIAASLYGVMGKPIWGDYDNDGDLDIFLPVPKLYMNNSETPNTVPSKPTALVTEIIGNSLYLSFSASTDTETPQEALTYNLDITLNGEIYLSGMSDLSSGYRKIVKEGNLNCRKNYSIPGFINLPQEAQVEKKLSWKVQTIDNCFAGSEFAADSIVIPSPSNLILQNNFLMTEFDLLKWEYALPDTVDHYVIQIDEDSLFNSPLEHSYTISKTGKIITFLSVPVQDFSGYETMRSHTTYFWRVKPVYINGSLPTVFSEEPGTFIYIPYDIAPGTPQNFTITHVSSDIVLTWNAVEVKQKGVTYNVYSSADPYAEFPAGFILEQSGITTTSWSKPVSVDKKFYVVTAYYSLQ
jgi:hypothetical protein